MYTSTEDARSDLMLAGAVFVFGPLAISVLLELIPLHTIPGVLPVLAIVIPLATTVLVPFLLIRYRREPWSMYGLGTFSPPTFAFGLLLGLPLAVAMVLIGVVAGEPLATVPVASLGGDGVLVLLARLAHWLGYAFIAVYGTVKARDAFRSYAEHLVDRGWKLARILGIVVAIASGLWLLAVAAQGVGDGGVASLVEVVLPPLAAGVAVVLVLRGIQARATATKASLVTPVVLMALAAATISFDPLTLVRSIYLAAIFGLIGLAIGALQESRANAWGAVGLGLTIATTTTFGQSLMLV